MSNVSEVTNAAEFQPAFLIGAQKSGSTFLHNLLKQSPEIAVYCGKETHFFSSSLHGNAPFAAMFTPKPKTRVLLDSSVSYLHTTDTAARIADFAGRSAPIIAVIRDPVERAISAYLHSVKHGREMRPPEVALGIQAADYPSISAIETEAAERALRETSIARRPRAGKIIGDLDYHDPLLNFRYVSNSFYEEQLRAYDARFDDVIIVDFPDLVENPTAILGRVCTALGLAHTGVSPRVGRNDTRVALHIAWRRFARNLAADLGSIRALARSTQLLPAMRRALLDVGRMETLVQSLPWTEAARAAYERVRMRRI